MQIIVKGNPVGIMGLKAAMEEMADKFAEVPDEEAERELLRRLCGMNYIPDSVKQEYGEAFVREFKKFLGKPFEEESPERIQIKILGPGCANCDRLEQELMQVMSETRIIADMEHVRDIKEIGRYGVMGTPALIINGQVKSVGRIPPKSKLMEWLKEVE